MSAPVLQTKTLSLAHEASRPVIRDLDLALAPGTVTTFIGPNGSGKSTLLKGLVRLLAPRSGLVCLDGADLHRLPTREVAQKLGLLAQHADAPGGLTVTDLVRRGRYPHRGPWEPLGAEDERAVEAALVRCGVDQWRDRPVDELSGGQRQRVWIALTLAQETPVILLDEPTTFLDPHHQAEVLQLIRSLNAVEGKTLVLVLHDLAQAARVSHRVLALENGVVVADGPPETVLTEAFLERLYGVGFEVQTDPETGTVVPLPQSRKDLSLPPYTPLEDEPAAPRLVARGLQAGYHGRTVIGPIDLKFGAGFTAILGPNGCGKSTLLRTMAGLQRALGGETRLEGSLVRFGGRRLARQRAFLSQEAACPPQTTAQELASLGRYPHRGPWARPTAEDRRAVHQVLDQLDLGPWADTPVDHLSGGQRQRVWLALALVQGCPLILLDEPTSFLDPGHQIELLDTLWQWTREGARTVVAILHDPALAHQYADHIVEL